MSATLFEARSRKVIGSEVGECGFEFCRGTLVWQLIHMHTSGEQADLMAASVITVQGLLNSLHGSPYWEAV